MWRVQILHKIDIGIKLIQRTLLINLNNDGYFDTFLK